MKSIIFLIALSLGYYARASNADKFMYKGLELFDFNELTPVFSGN